MNGDRTVTVVRCEYLVQTRRVEFDCGEVCCNHPVQACSQSTAVKRFASHLAWSGPREHDCGEGRCQKSTDLVHKAPVVKSLATENKKRILHVSAEPFYGRACGLCMTPPCHLTYHHATLPPSQHPAHIQTAESRRNIRAQCHQKFLNSRFPTWACRLKIA